MSFLFKNCHKYNCAAPRGAAQFCLYCWYLLFTMQGFPVRVQRRGREACRP